MVQSNIPVHTHVLTILLRVRAGTQLQPVQLRMTRENMHAPLTQNANLFRDVVGSYAKAGAKRVCTSK